MNDKILDLKLVKKIRKEVKDILDNYYSAEYIQPKQIPLLKTFIEQMLSDKTIDWYSDYHNHNDDNEFNFILKHCLTKNQRNQIATIMRLAEKYDIDDILNSLMLDDEQLGLLEKLDQKKLNILSEKILGGGLKIVK